MPAVAESNHTLTPSIESIGAPAGAHSLPVFESLPEARGRRIVLLAVHHVRVGERIYTGGAEKYIQTVIRALLDAGASVHVGYSGTSIYEELLEAYHPRRLTVEQTGWINESLSGDARLRLSLLRDRRRWLRATAADTVFAVQQAGGSAFCASLLAARSLGLRVVTSIRQSPEPPPPASSKRWFGIVPTPHLWRRRLILRRRLPALFSHAVIYNSSRVASAYEEQYHFPANRAVVIPNGELSHADDAAQRRSIPTRIASVGRVSRAKGADTLLEAFAIVARRHPEVKLTYYGDGEMIPSLAEKAKSAGLNDRVSFAGYVSSRPEIYKAVDICVQPSRRESLSNTVVEALTRGIPCVVSDVGGMREAVVEGENGYIVATEDANAYAGAISRLISDREQYVRFSRSAMLHARREFDLRKRMRETVKVVLGVK